MKRIIYLLTLSLIFLSGCSKEDSTGLQDPSSAVLKFQKLSFDGNTFSSEGTSINREKLQTKSKASTLSKSAGDSGANGHFNAIDDNGVSTKVSFSSGSNGELGNWNMSGDVNFKGDVICAVVEDNQAVVQVLITKVGEIPEDFSHVFVVGNTLLYLLEDNGEGFKAPSDRYWDYILFIPFPLDFCLESGPAEYQWIFSLGLEGFPEPGVAQFIDTAKKSDQIQVE